MATIITRTSWCPVCAKNENPKSDQLFLVYGASHNAFDVRRAAITPVYFGFTPHIVEIVKVIGQNVVWKAACSMNGCDVEIWSNGDNWRFEYNYSSKGIMSITEWNAWVNYKRDFDYLI